jgi:putative endonuclease
VRGWRVLGANVRAGGNELDLIVRRGRSLRFVEVKERTRSGFGGAIGAVGEEKQRRVRRAAEAYLAAHPELARLDLGFDVVAVEEGRLERLGDAFYAFGERFQLSRAALVERRRLELAEQFVQLGERVLGHRLGECLRPAQDDECDRHEGRQEEQRVEHGSHSRIRP